MMLDAINQASLGIDRHLHPWNLGKFCCAQLVEEKSDWWKGYRLLDPSKQQGSFPKTLVKKMSKDALLRKGYS